MLLAIKCQSKRHAATAARRNGNRLCSRFPTSGTHDSISSTTHILRASSKFEVAAQGAQLLRILAGEDLIEINKILLGKTTWPRCRRLSISSSSRCTCRISRTKGERKIRTVSVETQKPYSGQTQTSFTGDKLPCDQTGMTQ